MSSTREAWIASAARRYWEAGLSSEDAHFFADALYHSDVEVPDQEPAEAVEADLDAWSDCL